MEKIKIEKLIMDILDENCYIVHKEGRAIIIDPGAGFQKIINKVESLFLKVEAIILTHAHFDHIVSLDKTRKYFKVPVYISPKEKMWLESPKLNLSEIFLEGLGVKTFPAEFEFENYKIYKLAGINFKVLPTPGHSPGGLSFDFGEFIVVGDALFRSGYGRYDLPGADYKKLKNSLHNVLFKLDEDKIVYSGHGEETNIGREKKLDLI